MAMEPIKVYCEHNSHRPWLRLWQRAGMIQLVRFPYDRHSYNRSCTRHAVPSAATWQGMNLTYEQCGNLRWDSAAGSDRFQEIAAIIGSKNFADVLHVDSASKSGCQLVLSGDKDHIIENGDRLHALLGIRFFHPNDREAIEQYLVSLGLRRPVNIATD